MPLDSSSGLIPVDMVVFSNGYCNHFSSLLKYVTVSSYLYYYLSSSIFDVLADLDFYRVGFLYITISAKGILWM